MLCISILIIVLCLSLNSVSAEDVNLTDEYSSQNTDILTYNVNLLSDNNSQNIKSASNNLVIINVNDSYVPSANTWSESGVSASGALIQIFGSNNNNLVYQQTTDHTGKVQTSLPSGNYNLKINYDSYEEYSQSFTVSNSPIIINHVFYPDILFFVDYSSHNEKIDILMNLSKRVCYVGTMNYNRSQEWLFEHANFIQIDMYNLGSYSFDLHSVLKDSPANKNYNVAYTFGVYTDEIFNMSDIHFIGANPENNTPDTIENTYIGSYFQANDINDTYVLNTNMVNLLDYIKYLLNPEKYDNPTLDSTRTPLLTSETGIYHPDYGTLTLTPSQEVINSWILSNPGYNDDGIGSLNWKTTEYAQWQIENLNGEYLITTFEKWYKQNKNYDKPFIAIVSYYPNEPSVEALIKELESQGRPAFNMYQYQSTPSMSSMLVDAVSASTIGISAVISLYSWSLNYGNVTAEPDLSKLNLTVVKAVYDISLESYNNELGPQMEWTHQVTIPGFEGVFGALVVSYVDELGNSIVIQPGIEKLAKLAMGWANLKESENSDKKITIVLYNYPPGKAEIGASYLDVFQSTYDLLVQLYYNGYDLGVSIDNFPTLAELTETITNFGNKGSWAQGLLNEYVEKNWDYLMEHNQLISLDEFYQLTGDVNPNLMKELVDYWGDGPGGIMVYNNEYLVIPGVHFGNVFITFQPSRGWEEVENYHDTTLPPHQQYVAFYEWLDKKLKTDAIVYMGTHGTLEFLPGHQIGVQEGDWTFELTLTPSIYVYIVSNPGEAMMAKDRIGALMITHMTPAIIASELYGNYSRLSQSIDGYNNAIKLNVSSNAESYKEQILEQAKNLGFDLPDNGESFDDWLNNLHNYLDEMEGDINALGLHSIGKILRGEELVEEVVTIVTSQTKIYNNLTKLLFPELAGYDYYDDLRGNPNYENQAAQIKELLYEIVRLIINGTSVDELAGKYGWAINSTLYNNTIYISQIIQNIYANNEWNALMAALGGSYVHAGLFADPAYGDSIPTGNNGYATDHTKVPSKASYDSAVKIIDMLLVNYYEAHGSWPELIGLVLWGTEISRTEGIGISEYLYLLGCRPVWSDTGTVLGVELLPLEDLTVKLSNGAVINRPRIDVYASMVTSNVNWIQWMVTATNLAFNAEGEDMPVNYVKKHYAENPSLDRLFGLPGNILEGTGMSTLIPNTADWDIETVNELLADIYMNKVSYAWTLDENGKIVISQQKDNYAYLLGKTDLITQNFDSTWRLFDSDDYYDWFGGLLNAAKYYGANPDTAFVDIRNKNDYTFNSYKDEIYFEIRSVLINPKYVTALLTTDAGFNSWASKYQNLYGSLVVGEVSINTNLGLQMVNSISDAYNYVDSTTKAAAFSSTAAWMLYSAFDGLWEMTDSNGNPVDNSFKKLLSSDSISVSDVNNFLDSLSPELRAALQDLANKYIESSVNYDVACCHHTCNNINFNKLAMVVSTLSQSQKQAFSERLSQATLTDPIYEDLYTSGENQGSSSNEGNTDVNDRPADALVNGTTEDNSNDDGEGGITAFGSQPADEANAQSVSSSSSSSSASAQASQSSDSGAGASGQEAYEISKKSVSKSSANPQSSMPGYFIVAVVALIVLFGFGYYRGKN